MNEKTNAQLTVSQVQNIILKALERHALNQYGQTYKTASGRSEGARLEFENLTSILIEVIDQVEMVLTERNKNG